MSGVAHYLCCEAISKRFPGVQALAEVSLGVSEGSIHALVGENGAGKSTLLKILAGAERPDSGSIRIGGHAHVFRSAADSFRAGIAVIHQELNLVPEMTVAENVYLGHLPTRAGLLSKRELRRLASRQFEPLGESLDLGARVGSLAPGQRQMVEIAKALARDARVLCFDEPTSSLSGREAERLLGVIRDLRDAGRAIIYVSHRLREIFQICDCCTVLRDGSVAAAFPSLEGVTRAALVNRMVGRDIEDVYGYSPRALGRPALELRALDGPGLSAPIDLMVRQGEILGLFGLVGAGRTELLKLVFGATRPTSGEVFLGGTSAPPRDPGTSIRRGLALCPEDRQREGLVPLRPVGDNINLTALPRLSKLGIRRRGRELENAQRMRDRLDVRASSLDQLAGLLSGGNQQKVVLARSLAEDVRVVLLDEPTRGIDVGAKSEVYRLVRELAERGLGIVLASSDLPEVLGLADRVAVMCEGRLVGVLPREETTEEAVLRMALPSEETDPTL